MKTVTASFTAAEDAATRTPKIKLIMQLRNIAAAAEGAIISASSGDFSTDFPKEGANNGDCTHLNYGAASTAENKVGRAGWKSTAAGSSKALTTAADWTGGTQTQVIDVGNAAELALTTSRYEQDFDGLATGNLAGKDGWSLIGGGNQTIATAADFGNGTNGLSVACLNAVSTHQRDVTFGNTIAMTWRQKFQTVGSNDSISYLALYYKAGAATRYLVGMRKQTLNQVVCGTAITTLPDVPFVSSGEWLRFALYVERSTAATSTVSLYVRRTATDAGGWTMISSGVFDTSNIDAIQLISQETGAVAGLHYYDEIRIGEAFNTSGTQENVHDFTTAPVDGMATLVFNGEASKVSRQVTGCVASMNSTTAAQALRDAAARTQIGQTFTATESVPINSIWLNMAKVGSPVGNVHVAIYAVDGSNYPTGNALARSKIKPVADLTTTLTETEMVFPQPFIPTTTNVFAFVLEADFTISGANYVTVSGKTGGSSYTGGRYIAYNAGWSETTTADINFAMMTNIDIEEADAAAVSSDLVVPFSSASLFYVSQGFKVPYTVSVKHIAMPLRLAAGGTLAAKDRIWWEIQGDDGTGKPDNVALLTSMKYNPANLTDVAGRWWVISASTAYQLVAGTQYHLVLKCNTDIDLDSRIKWYGDSATDYTNGGRCVSTTAATPVWSAVANASMLFRIYGDMTPFIRFDGAYSTDNITYGAYAIITDNPTRAGSLAAFSFTGETKRYWKLKATLINKPSAWGSTVPITPALFDYTVKAVWHTAKTMTVDLGSNQAISQVEIFSHPTEHGCRKFALALRNATPAAVSFTADMTTSQSLGEGILGAITNPSGSTFSQTGDLAIIRFSADVTVRYIDLTINQNDYDEYGRVIEIRARRIVDVSTQAVGGVPQNRIVSFLENRDADSVLRKVKARSLTLVLANSDYYLSSENTSGPYYGQLGAGVSFVPFCGFENVADMVPMGVYYVDEWDESASSPSVTISLRDRVKYMSKSGMLTAKTGYKHSDIIEYLGNLAGISSMEMDIDLTAGTVDQFPENEVTLYEEAQKVAEACGFSALYFDDYGRLIFKTLGITAGNTNTENISSFINVYGPVQEIDGVAWCAVTVLSGGQEALKLYYRTVGTDTGWTVGPTISTKGATHSALLTKFDGKIYVLDFDADAGAGTKDADLWVYDPVAATTTKVSRFLNLSGARSPATYAWPGLAMDDNIWIIGGGRDSAWYGYVRELDLLTGISTDIATGVAADNDAIIYEGGKWTVFCTAAAYGQCTVLEWTRHSNAFTLVATVGAFYGYIMGAQGDGAGNILFVYARADGTAGNASLHSLNTTTWVDTESNSISAQSGASSTQPDCGALVYANNRTFGAWPLYDGTNYGLRHIYRDTNWSTEATDMGAISSGAVSAKHYKLFSLFGREYVFGINSSKYIFEALLPTSVFSQTTSVFSITDTGPFSEFADAQLMAGDDTDGDSSIINLAILKSTPQITGALSVTLWEKTYPSVFIPQANILGGLKDNGGVLVDTTAQSIYSFRLSYTNYPTDPTTLTLTATYTGGAPTITRLSSGQTWSNWRVVGGVAGTTLTKLVLTGYKLEQPQTMITVAVGSSKSLNRYDIREFNLENNYIYNEMSQAIIAADVVARYQFHRPRIRGLKLRARWELEIFDRITVTETQHLFVNRDYYIVRMRRDYLTQIMELEVAG